MTIKNIRFYIAAAINDTYTHFSGFNAFTTVKSATAFFPEINVGLDLFANKNVQRLLFRLNLGLTTNSLSLNYPDVNQYTTVFKIKQDLATLNSQILYNVYNAKGFKVYGSLGFGLSVSLHSNTQYYNAYNMPGVPSFNYDLQNTDQHYFLQPFYFTPNAKIGLVLNNRFDVNVGYAYAVFGGNHGTYSTISSTGSAGINYLFDK